VFEGVGVGEVTGEGAECAGEIHTKELESSLDGVSRSLRNDE
jgi:hypothetical protein